jgi:hypothetical protein
MLIEPPIEDREELGDPTVDSVRKLPSSSSSTGNVPRGLRLLCTADFCCPSIKLTSSISRSSMPFSPT